MYEPNNQFLDSFASNLFIPYNLQPTGLSKSPQNPNIFPNIISHKVVSRKITATIVDHLLQFLYAPNLSCKKSNIYERFGLNLYIRISYLHLTIAIKISLLSSNLTILA